MAEVIKSFRKIKTGFYGRFPDLSVFNCGELNLLKVVLDGIKVDYVSKGKIRVITGYPDWLFRLMLKLYRLRGGIQFDTDETCDERDLIVVEPSGRVYQQDGKDISFYTGKLLAYLGRTRVWHITEGNRAHQYDTNTVIQDYSIRMLAALPLDQKFYSLKRDVNALLTSMRKMKKFSQSELENIDVAAQQFLIQYAYWSNLIADSKAKTAFLWPHYHREGCILALKRKGISVHELQHGLIAEEDIFYGFPMAIRNVKAEMLFADRIHVYGNFWREQVIKGNAYTTDNIVVSGYFAYSPEEDPKKTESYRSMFPESRIILVTTQTFLHETFVKYIQFLSDDLIKRKAKCGILVKLHPAEKRDLYAAIETLANVRIVNDSIDTLLRASDIHVSVYSTTMFDAIRSGVPNFSIYHQDLLEYIEMFVKEGISSVIQPNENVLDRVVSTNKRKEVDWYYTRFDPETLN